MDANGYVGYTPPPQFDPLLAKVVGTSVSRQEESAVFAAAVDRTRRALDEFHVGGLATNIAQLKTILQHPDVRTGDARTTLLGEEPALLASTDNGNGALALLQQQATVMGVSTVGGAGSTPTPAAADLEVAAGQEAVACPMAGSVLEVRAQEGDRVQAGDPLLVVSAMKMESQVAAPCTGTVAAAQPLQPGDNVDAGQVFAVIAPAEGAERVSADDEGQTWAPLLRDVATMQTLAHKRLAPGSEDPGVVRQRSRGKLTCRERIDLLLDAGSFREVGSIAGFASYDEYGTITDFTPANHVGGWGKIEGRGTVVCADDFTSRGGHADGAIGAKSGYLDRLALELRLPSIRLLDGSSGGGSVAAMVPKQKAEGESTAKESSGAIKAGRPRVAGGGGSFLPGHLGSAMYTEQLSTVPVVNMLLGSVVGIGAAKAVLGHFSVMVRDIAQLFVAGPPVVQHAMGYDITKEDLGGWHIHCRNGSVDNLAETEEEAAELTRRFLSYLPSSVYETPPVAPPRTDDPPDRRDEELFTLIPRKRTTTFDVRKAIRLMADRDSYFEVGPLWGTDQVTGFARFNGHPVGVIASDSQHANGGALTADGCSKLTRHLDLCDLFHVPVLNLVDSPGFAVGLEHEITGTIRRGGEWMVAFSQVTVPIFTVVMRRSFGVAGNNYATPRSRPSVRVAWPAADAGGIPSGRRHRGGLQASACGSRGSPRLARRTHGPHRERARADRPVVEVPDRGNGRSPRHATADLRVGGDGLAAGHAAGQAWAAGVAVSTLEGASGSAPLPRCDYAKFLSLGSKRKSEIGPMPMVPTSGWRGLTTKLHSTVITALGTCKNRGLPVGEPSVSNRARHGVRRCLPSDRQCDRIDVHHQLVRNGHRQLAVRPEHIEVA